MHPMQLRFWDKSLEVSMGALNSFINGSYEGGEAIGLFANDTQLASYAVKQGIVSEAKEWANLDEAKKQATRLQYAQDMMAAFRGNWTSLQKKWISMLTCRLNWTEKWWHLSRKSENLCFTMLVSGNG